MHAAATGGERERERAGEAIRGAEGGREKRGRRRGVEAQREGWKGVGEGGSEEEEEFGGWAHGEVSDAGHVPFVERLVEGGGAVEEALRREVRGER